MINNLTKFSIKRHAIDVLLANKYNKGFYSDTQEDLNKNLVPYLDNYDRFLRLFLKPQAKINKNQGSSVLLNEDPFQYWTKKHSLIRFSFKTSFFNLKKNNLLFSLNKIIYYLTRVSSSNLYLIFLAPKKSGFISYFNGIKGFVFNSVLFKPIVFSQVLINISAVNSFFFSFIVRVPTNFIKLKVTQTRKFKRIFNHRTKTLGKKRSLKYPSIKYFFYV